MAQCLTDGAVYEITVGRRHAQATSGALVHSVVRIPRNVDLPPADAEEIKERVHRGLEWALAPWFVGIFQDGA